MLDAPATTTTSSTPSRGSPATSGIAAGQVPPEHYFHLVRTFPPLCDVGDFQEMQPSGVTRTYLGVDVFEGHYDYRGMHIVPTWGGDMFEALMVAALRARGALGRRGRGASTTRSTCARRSSTASTRRATATGASRPATTRRGGYSDYGVDAIGMHADGYPSNNDNTFVDHGFGDCRPAKPDPPPSAYTNGVVTPHASFLALRYAPRRRARQPREAARALRRLRQGRLLRRRQRRRPARWRAPTSRSTRAWSWPRPPTR